MEPRTLHRLAFEEFLYKLLPGDTVLIHDPANHESAEYSVVEIMPMPRLIRVTKEGKARPETYHFDHVREVLESANGKAVRK